MNLMIQAEADNAFILEDSVNGFGRAMTYTLAAGTPTHELIGQFIRRGTKIDPASGLPIAGDEASVTFRLSTFRSLFGSIDPAKGDIIAVGDSTGTTIAYKVSADGIMLDKTAGRATLTGLKRIA